MRRRGSTSTERIRKVLNAGCLEFFFRHFKFAEALFKLIGIFLWSKNRGKWGGKTRGWGYANLKKRRGQKEVRRKREGEGYILQRPSFGRQLQSCASSVSARSCPASPASPHRIFSPLCQVIITLHIFYYYYCRSLKTSKSIMRYL